MRFGIFKNYQNIIRIQLIIKVKYVGVSMLDHQLITCVYTHHRI